MQTSPDIASETNIVIVDDTPDNLRLLFTILSKHGYRVRPLLNGSMALTAIRKEPPDLILLDIMMPDMDGYTVCETLKASEHTRHIPVIFLSALSEVFDKVRAFSLGGVDYITKPFHSEEVLARVSIHVEMKQMRSRLQAQNMQFQHVNEQLTHSIDNLMRQNRQMDQLNRLSTFLQRAETFNEAIDLSLPFLRELFADSPGALYILRE
jgi:PleD family two-component response regulator